METEKEEKIVARIEGLDAQHLPFVQVKQTLLGEGLTESEIVYALYSVPEDGGPKQENPLRQYYIEHPQKAQMIAKSLLLMEQEKERADLSRNMLASMAAGASRDPDTEAQANLALSDSIGLPTFTILFFFLAFWLYVIFSSPPPEFIKVAVQIFGAAYTILFITAFVLHIRNLRKK